MSFPSESQAKTSASPPGVNRFEKHSRLTACIIMALLFVMLIGALEFGLRWIHPIDTGTSFEYRIPHPRFGWVLAPGVRYINRLHKDGESVPVSYNADGWRDLPRADYKPEGVTRVLVLGDSFMEAYSVVFEESMSARLEKLLNTDDRQVEVINLGVGGYGTLQEYLVFDALGRAYRPDIVVLAMYLNNDLRNNTQALELLVSSGVKAKARPFLEPEVSGASANGEPSWQVTQVDFEGSRSRYEEYQRRKAEPLNFLVEHSALLQLAKLALVRAKRLFSDPNHSARASLRRRARIEEKRKTEHLARYGVHYCDLPLHYTQAWDITRRILARLNREVRNAGARLLVMSVPGLEQVNEDKMAKVPPPPKPWRMCLEQASANRHLGKLLAQLNIDYLDLLPAFRETHRQTGIELFRRSDQHWNPQGHGLAASELAAMLEQRGYLVSHAGATQ